MKYMIFHYGYKRVLIQCILIPFKIKKYLHNIVSWIFLLSNMINLSGGRRATSYLLKTIHLRFKGGCYKLIGVGGVWTKSEIGGE